MWHDTIFKHRVALMFLTLFHEILIVRKTPFDSLFAKKEKKIVQIVEFEAKDVKRCGLYLSDFDFMMDIDIFFLDQQVIMKKISSPIESAEPPRP